MQKVIICNDAPFMQSILKDSIDSEHFHVVAEVSMPQDLLNVSYKEQPDIVLLDLMLHGKDSLELLGELKHIVPNVYVIMCAPMGKRALIMSAIQAGASDFIIKPYEEERVRFVMSKAIQN